MANGAKRHMYIFAASDSERERERERKRERTSGREGEILRALLGRKPFSVLLINEPPESVYVLALCRRE